MLDTYGRKYFDRLIMSFAKKLSQRDISPTTITYMALVIGILSSVFVYFNYPYLSILLLWTSGFLDTLDGKLARISNKVSDKGMLLDIFFDRIVEGGILLALAFKYPFLQLGIVTLFFAILLSITIFLISGSVIKNHSEKSFHYQAGLMERTEGFIFLTLAILFYTPSIIYTFAFLIGITIIQRFIEVKKYL